VKEGVVGAAGYAGGELLRLLLSHPKADEIVAQAPRRGLLDDLAGGDRAQDRREAAVGF